MENLEKYQTADFLVMEWDGYEVTNYFYNTKEEAEEKIEEIKKNEFSKGYRLYRVQFYEEG